MTPLRRVALHVLVLATVVAAIGGAASAQSRSVGQVIDDTAITAEIKAKLTADQISNLTKIGVNTRAGVVTLSGTVDTPERQARAVQIASSVKGVREVVNAIAVAAPAVPPAAALPPQPAVDATGVVARVDPHLGTVTLQDGRVLRLTDQTIVWQPTAVQALQPGATVLLRGAAPLGVQPVPVGAPEWRMGTVRSVDRGANQIMLTDGTLVRVAPTASVRRGQERLMIDQVPPGAEIVVGVLPRYGTTAEGGALPASTAVNAVVDASDVNVVWMPSVGLR